MTEKKSRLLQAFVETPWAILPQKFFVLEEVVLRHVSGEKLDADEVQARIHGATRPPERRINKVAVLPLFGTIFPRANMMTDMSGATSAERFGANFAKLVNDPEVDAIVLDVDSPGGVINGVEELSKQIFDARGTKPIIAVANHMMASAAYWIGTAADELVVSPSGEVGSIGVFAVHEDISGALEKDGVKVSIIKEGKYKAEGNPYEPLSEEARAAIQEKVSEAYGVFVGAVARNRGVSVAIVRNAYGEGRMVSAQKAVDLGMADRVGTLDETINNLLNGSMASSQMKAEDDTVLEVNDADRQEPIRAEEEPSDAQARRRLALARVKNIQGANIMNLREMQKQRGALLDEAKALAALADSENRDFTDQERERFNEIVGEGGEIDQLDAKIETIMKERAALEEKALKQVSSKEPQKPEAVNEPKVMKRAEYDQLGPQEKIAFTKSGGRVE
jgi:signal peptide peptidase SppA